MTAKKSVITIICLITLTGLLYIGSSFFNQLACEGQPINNNVSPTEDQQIIGGTVIGQSFTAPRDGLSRLDVFLQTYQRRNTHDVTLRLFETPNAETWAAQDPPLFSVTFNAATVSDQSWRSFYFAPLLNSSGKTYLLTLESPSSTDGNAITVGGIERNSYLPGTAFLGPIPVPVDITFRSCYQMTAKEKLSVLTRQLTQNKTGPWQDGAFYGLSLILYLLLLLGFLVYLLEFA